MLHPLLSRASNTADFHNTQKRHRELGKMSRQKNMSQMKEQKKKIIAINLSKMEISNMPDRI